MNIIEILTKDGPLLVSVGDYIHVPTNRNRYTCARVDQIDPQRNPPQLEVTTTKERMKEFWGVGDLAACSGPEGCASRTNPPDS